MLEEHLYRLAQEALHNVVKHARGRAAIIRHEIEGSRLLLEVIDDGVGFDPEAVSLGHMGLRNMAERAAQAGGSLTVESRPGHGTAIRLKVPYDKAG